MSDELFDIPVTKSPRLQWMDKHGIQIIDNGKNFEPGDECEFSGDQLYRYCAHNLKGEADPVLFFQHLTGYGHTQDEAIIDFAIKNEIKLWNEV